MDRADVNLLASAQSEVVRMARADLTAYFNSLDLSKPAVVRDALIEYVPLLVSEYGDMAATAAAEWYEGQHPGSYQAILADAFPADGVVAGVRYQAGELWSANPQSVLDPLSGALQRYVQYSGRETVARNVIRDPAKPRFGRVPTGAKTCAWCTLIASRGFVYLSKSTAGEGHGYHNDCDCQAVPEWESNQAHISGYDPDAMYEQYQTARQAAQSDGLPLTDANIATQMRRLFPESFSDGLATS